MLFLTGMVLGTLCFGGHLMASNVLTAGDLMSFLVSTQMIQRSMAQMSLLFGSYIKGLSSGARIFEVEWKIDVQFIQFSIQFIYLCYRVYYIMLDDSCVLCNYKSKTYS